MRDQTSRIVEDWWSRIFDVDPGQLWRSTTVLHPHGELGDYTGWYVAWRESGVHVSAPSAADAADVASLGREPVLDLQAAEFWHAFALQRGHEVMGPSTHCYLDVAPGPSDRVVELTDLAALRETVTEAEWTEAGMAHQPAPPVRFALVEDDRPVAVAVRNDWDGAPRDIGVLVAPHARGRGLASVVGGHAASYAVRETGRARWRYATTNVASARTAQRLGFEPYATQLAVRPSSA